MSENFQVDLGGVLELLSEHLYTTPDVFVRELLQNASDAIAARRTAEPNHEGSILFDPDKSAGVLTVVDDGIGLSEDEARNFLSRVGASIKREGPDRSTYIGQFGVGILSCFMVADEITVLTRRLGDEGPGIRWTGQSDGTFRIEPLTANIRHGTQVTLTLNKAGRRYAGSKVLNDVVSRYGKYLETDISIGRNENPINIHPTWEAEVDDEDDRDDLLTWAEYEFGRRPLDVIDLDTPRIGLRGVAYVLPDRPANAQNQAHAVYLKRMFVTDRPGELLPLWAGFTHCVLCSDRLRPTASREAFYKDKAFAAVRKAVADRLREYLLSISRDNRGALMTLLEFQDQPFRQLAREDDEFFDAIIDLLPFDTSVGRLTFGDFRREHTVVRVTQTTDQFRAVAALAAARGVVIFNGGYTHHEALLERAVARDPALTMEAVDGRDMLEQLKVAGSDIRAAYERVAEAVEAALAPFGASVRLAEFEPADIASVYAESPNANLARSLRAAREMSQGMWQELVDAMSTQVNPEDELAMLCLNVVSPAVQRMFAGDADVAADAARLLYVQALLLAKQPLTAAETSAFTEALSRVLQRAAGEGGSA